MLKSFQTNILNKLYFKNQLDLLNSVDCLYSQNINYYILLLQIIVCDNQLFEKNFVLKTISNISFFVKSNFNTRFPTKLVLRKTSQIDVNVSIVLYQVCIKFEQLALDNFYKQLENFEELPSLIKNAKVIIEISIYNKIFSKDFFRIEISNSNRFYLTIVDLFEFIYFETKQQFAFNIELVQDVVQFYIKKSRNIILAIISTKNDYANQIVLKLVCAINKKNN